MRKNALAAILAVQFVLMTTLAWAETRIDELPYTIDEAGSYYVRGDLSVTGTGITIDADDVTLDMRGYTLSGNGTGYGIYIMGNNATLYNGTVKDFDRGIQAASNTINSMIEKIKAINNTNDGIDIMYGKAGSVKNCIVSGNGLRGIDGAEGSIISGNVAYNNANEGIAGDYGSIVTGNLAHSNGSNGINVNKGSNATGNTAYSNQASGIRAKNGGSVIKNNTTYGNQNYGIDLTSTGYYLVDGNTAYGNDVSNNEYSNISSCATCTFGTNVAP